MKPEVYDKTQKSFELAVKYLKNDTTQSETLSNSYRNLANLNRLRQNFELADSYIEKAQKLMAPVQNGQSQKELCVTVVAFCMQEDWYDPL